MNFSAYSTVLRLIKLLFMLTMSFRFMAMQIERNTIKATPHNEQSIQKVKKNTRQKCRVSGEIFSFLRKGIQNQTDG